MKILNFPITRITIWFILGIIICYYLKPNLFVGFGLLLFSLLFFALNYFRNNNSLNQTSNFGLVLYLMFFSIGISTTMVHNDSFKKNHYSHFNSYFTNNHKIIVTINEKLKTSTNNFRYIATINSIENKYISGKVLLQIKRNSINNNFLPGTQLLIDEQLVKNFKPNNPNQFDYGKYLEGKNIYSQVFTESSQIKISKNIEKDIWYYTSQFRNTIIKNLKNSGFKKEELAVISALILGQQQEISQEVLRDYQYAGAVHILSVSGLHVGFIMLFITFLLKPLPKNKFGNTTRLLVIILFLWLFAIVAGLAPSVVRSATMFSFLAFGLFLNRSTYVFHTLTVSLFLILLFEPLFLFDIGFQLSYAALFFILWFQPLLQNLWLPKNIILKYFWDILTVSFAAQIGAMPLSIYYFHQFPGLFFVTNLVLIPFLSVIMGLGLLLMILASLNWVPLLLSKTVEISITLTNYFIKTIASIETFIIKDIPLSLSLLFVSYLVIFSVIIWLKKPNFTKMIIALLFVFSFQIIYIATQWKVQKTSEFLVFNANKKTIVAERYGKKISLHTKDSLKDDSFEQKIIDTYSTANFCKIDTVLPLKNNYFFNQNKILIIDKSSIYKISKEADIIILTNSPKLNLERLIANVNPKMIVADASNYKTYVAVWKQTCLEQKIPFHSTYEKGFYAIKP